MKPSEAFSLWLERQPPPRRIGEVAILPGYGLRHVEDLGRKDLKKVDSLAALREIVKVDAEGNFRSLRGAPTLQTGWGMSGLDLAGLVEALDTIYPAALANWALREGGRLEVTEYRETAERQTGRFAIVKTLTETQVGELVSDVCVKGCLKKRLWIPLSEIPNPPSEIPLWCSEACNYLVGKAREKIKGPEEGE
jgi:hypothetical protein